MNASARRVLFTKWVGKAWEEVSANRDMIVRSFEKVGIAVPIDGSGDDQINIEGLEEYSVDMSEEESTDTEDPFASSNEDSSPDSDEDP